MSKCVICRLFVNIKNKGIAMKSTLEVYPNLHTFTERLNYAYSRQDLSQTRIAKMAGIAQPTFNELLAGKYKSSKKSEELAEALNVDYQWLVTGIPSEDAGNSESIVNIPLVEGYDNYINTQLKNQVKKPHKFMQLDIKALRKRGINFHDARYVPMTDKSMGIVINEDSPVFFDTTQKLIEDGMAYVISHGGILQVRLLFNAPMGSIKLQAVDSRFETISLNMDQQEQQLFEILGQVFAVVNYY